MENATKDGHEGHAEISSLQRPSQSHHDIDYASLQFICQRMYQWCGVNLSPDKAYLIRNRLQPLLNELGLSDLAELVEQVRRTNSIHLKNEIVDRLTTHETLFFRDETPFAAAAEILQSNALISSQRRAKIWCAGCSTGQEPYSLAIKLKETLPEFDRWSIQIVATDVSTGTIEKARCGWYQEHELRRGLSIEQRNRYFTSLRDGWEVRGEIKSMVHFQVGDLTGAVYPPGPFDIVFCRNVLIYFDDEQSNSILHKIGDSLNDDGRLFVGCSEVLTGVSDFLKRDRVGSTTCYQPLRR